MVNAPLIVLISLNRGIPYKNEIEVQSPNTLKNKCWSAGVACNNSALTILKQTIRKFSFKPIIASSVLMKKRGKLLKNGAFIFKLPKEEKKRKIIEKWRIHIQIAKRGKSCHLASTNVREKKSRCEMMFSPNPTFGCSFSFNIF